MALRNAFGDLALQETANNSYIEQLTIEQNILRQILVQLKITNHHLSLITSHEITTEDLHPDIREEEEI